MCLIDEPQGVYYGGTIAAPVIKELYENILPYMEKSNKRLCIMAKSLLYI